MKNKANFNSPKFTATSYSTVVYNAFPQKTKNGTKPNKANLKPISNTLKPSLLLGEPAISQNLFYGKRTQFQRVKSVASNCYRKVYDALLQKRNEPKRTQLKPIKANLKPNNRKELTNRTYQNKHGIGRWPERVDQPILCKRRSLCSVS